MHLCTPIPSEMLAFELKADKRWKVSLLFSPEDTTSVISNKIVQFRVKYWLMRLKSLLVSILLHLKNDPIFHEFGM